MHFTTDAKLRACAAFVATLHSTAGCDPEEIKRLLSPELIDAYLANQKPEGNPK